MNRMPWYLGLGIFIVVLSVLLYDGVQSRKELVTERAVLQKFKELTTEDILSIQNAEGKTQFASADKAGLVKGLHSLASFAPSHPLEDIVLKVLTGPRTGSMSFEICVARASSQTVGYVFVGPGDNTKLPGSWIFSSKELVEWLRATGLMD
jgi:hypothetical protein